MTNDLRTAALAAYQEELTIQRERREEQAKAAERAAAAKFRAIFKVDAAGVAAPPDGPTTVYAADGLSFQWYDRNLYLLDECPRCGDYCMGQLIHNLESLGEALTDGFTPNYTHHCYPVVNTPESTGDRPLWIEDAVGMIDLASGHEGPATPRDAAALGQLYALIAIAAELKRIAEQVEIANSCQNL